MPNRRVALRIALFLFKPLRRVFKMLIGVRKGDPPTFLLTLVVFLIQLVQIVIKVLIEDFKVGTNNQSILLFLFFNLIMILPLSSYCS